MSGEIVQQDGKMALSARDVREQVNLIGHVMREVMQKDQHYGVIPGCNKPSLYKAGAEKLMVTFRLAPSFQNTITDDPNRKRHVVIPEKKDRYGKVYKQRQEFDVEGFFQVDSVCTVTHIPTGQVFARASAVCNNWEKKYIEQDPYEVRNTVTKMAEKRSMVAATLMAVGASDIFTQDVEDMDIQPEPKNIAPQVSRPQNTQEKRVAIQTRPEAPRQAEPAPPTDDPESIASLVLEADSAPSDPIVTNPELFDEVPASEVVKADDYMAIGPVAAVSVKEGEGKKGPWKLTKCKVGDNWYATFDRRVAEQIDYAKTEGLKVKIEYKDNPKGGRDITDLEVL